MWTIDRIEGTLAVIEFENVTFTVPLSALPVGAKEGDVLNISIDVQTTKLRRQELRDKMNRLFQD